MWEGDIWYVTQLQEEWKRVRGTVLSDEAAIAMYLAHRISEASTQASHTARLQIDRLLRRDKKLAEQRTAGQ